MHRTRIFSRHTRRDEEARDPRPRPTKPPRGTGTILASRQTGDKEMVMKQGAHSREEKRVSRRGQRRRPRFEAERGEGFFSMAFHAARLLRILWLGPTQTARQNEQNWHESGHEKERRASSLGEERWPISRYSAHMP